MSNGEVCSVRVQYRDVVGVANLLSLRRVMLEMLGKHVDRLPMLSHHRRWRSCPLRHRNHIRSASASTLDAPTRKGPAPRTRAGSAFDLHLESFPMLTQSCDFTLLFRVSYPVMISEPVSFSLFPVKASPRTFLLDLFTRPSGNFSFQPVCQHVSNFETFCTTKSKFQKKLPALKVEFSEFSELSSLWGVSQDSGNLSKRRSNALPALLRGAGPGPLHVFPMLT